MKQFLDGKEFGEEVENKAKILDLKTMNKDNKSKKLDKYSVIKHFLGLRKKLTYEERVQWFINNFYETGMEYQIMLESMKNDDLDNFKWYDDFIKIPKYKDEL